MSASPGDGVLIIVENLSVPFDRRVWQEATSLTQAGYHVAVICPQGVGRDEEPFAVIDGIEIHRYPLRAVTNRLRGYVREYLTAHWHTRRLVRQLGRQRRFAVVQACNPPDFLLLAALTLRRRGAAFVFDHHDLVPELYLSRFERGEDLGYRLTCLVERVAFRLADVVISTNESYRRAALQRGKVAPENVFVVRSAPDLTHFLPVAPVPALRQGKEHLIAYLGVMGPQDGVDHALRALAELRHRRDDWHAIFVGAGDVFEAMRALRTELGLDGYVEFTGRIPNEQLREILSTADVGLAPDPMNPLNDVSTMNKIVEYMALGLPVVSYDLTEARVSAAEAAVYTTCNDPIAFAEGIAELLDDPGRRVEMAELGKRRLAHELGWHHSDAELQRAYARALQRRQEKSSMRRRWPPATEHASAGANPPSASRR
jgi:glycosyltransferase involved in cell wall biosynthesis